MPTTLVSIFLKMEAYLQILVQMPTLLLFGKLKTLALNIIVILLVKLFLNLLFHQMVKIYLSWPLAQSWKSYAWREKVHNLWSLKQ